jgi:hypothetical protein
MALKSDRHEEWQVPRAPDLDGDWRERRRSTVRMFPDFAGSVLWFTDGLVSYEESALSAGLVGELQWWEQGWLDGLGDDYALRTPDLERRHQREGLRLARLLADELGDRLAVEFHRIDSDGFVMIRSRGAPTNRAAAAAFTAWADADRADEAEVERRNAEGESLGWWAPLSRRDGAAGPDADLLDLGPTPKELRDEFD